MNTSKQLEKVTSNIVPKTEIENNANTTGDMKPDLTNNIECQPAPGSSGCMNPYSKTASRIEMVVVDQNYPECLLSTEQLEAIQEAILEEIMKIQGGTHKPQFHYVRKRSGWLALMCVNKYTANWLEGLSAKLKPWEGAELKIIEGKDMPRSGILIGYLPGSADFSDEKILTLIKNQNDLETSNWRVVSRKPASKATISITFSVDAQTMGKLKKNKLNISYRFEQVQLRSGRKHARGTTTVEPSTSTASLLQ